MPLDLAMELLRKIALGDPFELSEEQRPVLNDLLEKGLIRRMDPLRKTTLNQSAEELQEQHSRLLEAKACVERLARKSTPRTGLGGLFSFSQAGPIDAKDPDAILLMELLAQLEIRVRTVDGPRDLEGRIEKVRSHVLVAARDCLDRMTALDRETHAIERQVQLGTLVEPIGTMALTESGHRELPESAVMDELEAVFNAVSGPRKHKIEDFSHFREDPASLLIFMMDNPWNAKNVSQQVMDYESLADAFERIGPFAEIRSFRTRNAFLMRLCMSFRDSRRPFQLCNRERLISFLDRSRAILGSHANGVESLLVASWDLLGHELLFPQATLPSDALFPQILESLQACCADRKLGDRTLLHVAMALHILWQRPGLELPDGFKEILNQQITVIQEALNLPPADLGVEHSRWCFAYHMAHLAGFSRERLKATMLRYRAAERAFMAEDMGRMAPVQVVLHAVLSLQRLELAGRWLDPQKYAATFRRIMRRILGYRDLWRSLQGSGSPEEDMATLAAYLTARCHFRDIEPSSEAAFIPDAGMAGWYEGPAKNRPPLLGAAFGTMML